jgi:hypothetical protein
MTAITNPARDAFIRSIGSERTIAQVIIRRRETGYELRHLEDRDGPPELLRELRPEELRPLVQFTATGAFRPLKSAPTLQRGWRLTVENDAALEAALNRIYPGAIADWHAARAPDPPITHYREFTGRQTGMYRITTMLSNEQVGEVIRTVCHPGHCLKRRLWTVEGTAPDDARDKSLIPCLEPCALLLESARTTMRNEQGSEMKAEENHR